MVERFRYDVNISKRFENETINARLKRRMGNHAIEERGILHQGGQFRETGERTFRYVV